MTNKAHKKQWHWPFAPDSRQEIIHLLGNEDSSDCVKRVNNKMAIANQKQKNAMLNEVQRLKQKEARQLVQWPRDIKALPGL